MATREKALDGGGALVPAQPADAEQQPGEAAHPDADGAHVHPLRGDVEDRHDEGASACPASTWASTAATAAAPRQAEAPARRPEVDADQGDYAQDERDAQSEEVLALPRLEERQEREGADQYALRPGHGEEADDRDDGGDAQQEHAARGHPASQGEQAGGGGAHEEREAGVEQPLADRREAVVQPEVFSRATVLTLPGAGATPTPKAKAPLATCPSTADTERQLTV